MAASQTNKIKSENSLIKCTSSDRNPWQFFIFNYRFVDGLKNCASMFQQCGDKQHASAVANMLSEYGTTLCKHHKFNIGAV